MKMTLLGLTLIVVGLGSTYYGRWPEENYAKKLAAHNANKLKIDEVNSFLGEFKPHKNWEDSFNGLPDDLFKKIEPHANIMKIIEEFQLAEDLLHKASALQDAMTLPPELDAPKFPYPVEVKNEPRMHPVVAQLMKQALFSYEASKIAVDKLPEKIVGDDVYNFQLRYLKGEIYHRYTELLSTPETVKEMLNQTLINYKEALDIKPGHRDTVANIELLFKNKNSMISRAAQPDNRPQQILKQAGKGNKKGH